MLRAEIATLRADLTWRMLAVGGLVIAALRFSRLIVRSKFLISSLRSMLSPHSFATISPFAIVVGSMPMSKGG